MSTHQSADDFDVHRFVDTTPLLASIAACPRGQRLVVISLLAEAVEDEYLDERTAEDILLEWDVDNFPEQLPKPVVDYVQRKPYRLLRSRPAQLSVAVEPELDETEPG